MLLVKPSQGNMHKFIAEEDSCFFDICLPNYTNDSMRRITYFNELLDGIDPMGQNRCKAVLEYHTTPPKLPVGFEVAEVKYRGYIEEDKKQL